MERELEQRIIERVIAGDREAAGELIRQHQRSVYAYLLRMSGRADVAEDIAQEAFVRVLTNIERFDFRYRFSTWLFTIARRLFLNHVQKMRPAYDSETVGQCAGGSGHDASARPTADDLRADRRDRIDAALQTLSADQREVIVLFHQFDWPISRIAEHLEMPEGTIKSHLHRGRRKLKEALLTERGAAESLDVMHGARVDVGVDVGVEGGGVPS